MAEAAAAIRALDTSRPISACFDTSPLVPQPPGESWEVYSGSVDVLLADIYPIAGNVGPNPCTLAMGCNVTAVVGDSIRQMVAATGKPVWYVPQAFGSQERFQREPSTGELRTMTYSALLAGATGNFFFTREDADPAPPGGPSGSSHRPRRGTFSARFSSPIAHSRVPPSL